MQYITKDSIAALQVNLQKVISRKQCQAYIIIQGGHLNF